MPASSGSPSLFAPPVPDGFEYRQNFISPAEERELLDAIEPLPFAQVVMRGVIAKRRTAHFGWTYGYYARRSEPGPPLPAFLLEARARCAAWAGIDAELFVEALVTEYSAGSAIGWHRDAPVFGDIVAGVSLLAACRMKFRPYVSPSAVRDATARAAYIARSRVSSEVRLPDRRGCPPGVRAQHSRGRVSPLFDHLPHASQPVSPAVSTAELARHGSWTRNSDVTSCRRLFMTELIRLTLVLALTAGMTGCGMLREDTAQGTDTVPEPVTPAQKATASPDNPDSAILADFNARLDNYIKKQRALMKGSPIAEDATPAQIKVRQETIAAELRAIRKDAKQGEIFTPEVAELFKRLMYPELKGPDAKETKQALSEEDGEVAQVQLKVNATWPASEPLTTTPANLLANLPQLPMDVEYRISNKRHLVLRDVDANIIVDFIYNAIR